MAQPSFETDQLLALETSTGVGLATAGGVVEGIGAGAVAVTTEGAGETGETTGAEAGGATATGVAGLTVGEGVAGSATTEGKLSRFAVKDVEI